jgi:hypothetical protein
MRLGKKTIIIGVLCIVVLAATIGGFAMASADNSTTANTTKTATAVTTLMDKVAEMYQKDTGTAIDAQALQKAFEEAGAAIRANSIDQMLQKLVTDGKITQAQADQWKAWWDSRPSQTLTDEYKTWMENRPDISGLSGTGHMNGMMPFRGTMPFRGNMPGFRN